MKPKIVIALNSAWNLVNFRANLIRALVGAGMDVVAVAPEDEYAARLPSLGCRYIALPMDRTGTHPARDALLLWRFLRILRSEKPACMLAYTAKPNIFGSLAAHILGVPVVNNVAGLGTAYMRKGMLSYVVSGLYRLALSRSRRVFFQNQDDLNQFVQGGIVNMDIAERLPGSGVDLAHFQPAALPERAAPRFMLVSRILWDKGVGEFADAAERIKARHPAVQFSILGFLSPEHPAGVPEDVVRKWSECGLIEYLGSTDDVRPYLADVDCVVLPSYREGTPRSLLEAAAMGRPIITTNVPGCRDVIEDKITGYLCEPRDADSLAAQIERFINLPQAERNQMGELGRLKVEREFSEQYVVNRYLEEIKALP